MSSWTVTDLSRWRTWNFDEMMVEAFKWPSREPTRPLSALTVVLFPEEEIDPDFPIITPRGIDDVTGILRRRYRGHVGVGFRVGGFGRALEPGDLLVPAFDAPVLFVNETLVGSLASSQFLAFRPVGVEPLWLWGVLNSSSGQSLRRLLTVNSDGKADSHVALSGMQIPLPDAETQHVAAQVLALVELSLRNQEVEAPTTWSKVTNLRGAQWRFALGAANPALLQEGEPLSSYCSVVRGRLAQRREREWLDLATGVLPEATGVFLAGRSNALAPVTSKSTVVQPGDVLASVIGERPRARVVDQAMVASSSVFVIRPNDPGTGPAIANYLNSAAGLARWRFLALDGIVPQMSLSDLRAFPIPEEVLVQSTAVLPSPGPLGANLERLLWPS